MLSHKQVSMLSQRHVWFTLLRTLTALTLLLTSPGFVRAGTDELTTLSNTITTPTCDSIIRFDPNNFPNPTTINNKWFPLVPGTQFVLEGRANRGGAPLPHRVVTTVTDLGKVVNGVRSLVILDKDFNEGQIEESELAFFAQDNAGNVWSLGEYPEVYRNGTFSGAPDTWLAGLKNAQAGLMMLAKPRLETSRYVQGFSPNIDFLDCAKVFAIGLRTCVPSGCYKNILLTDETSPLDPEGGHQRKYHAPGVGVVRVGAVHDPEGEILVLVEIVHLTPTELAVVREEALQMDAHAYQARPILYGNTPPAEPLAGGLDPEAGDVSSLSVNQNSGQGNGFTLYLPVILK